MDRASHHYCLQLTITERQLLGQNADKKGLSVANYIRSYIPELQQKTMGRPRKDLQNG